MGVGSALTFSRRYFPWSIFFVPLHLYLVYYCRFGDRFFKRFFCWFLIHIRRAFSSVYFFFLFLGNLIFPTLVSFWENGSS